MIKITGLGKNLIIYYVIIAISTIGLIYYQSRGDVIEDSSFKVLGIRLADSPIYGEGGDNRSNKFIRLRGDNSGIFYDVEGCSFENLDFIKTMNLKAGDSIYVNVLPQRSIIEKINTEIGVYGISSPKYGLLLDSYDVVNCVNSFGIRISIVLVGVIAICLFIVLTKIRCSKSKVTDQDLNKNEIVIENANDEKLTVKKNKWQKSQLLYLLGILLGLKMIFEPHSEYDININELFSETTGVILIGFCIFGFFRELYYDRSDK